MRSTPVESPLLVDMFSPAGAVRSGRWIDKNGAEITAAGVRAHALAFDEFSAADVANAAGVPGSKLTGIRFGFGEAVLGDTVADGAFGATDNQGRTVTATAGQEILCYVPKGGSVGQRVRVLILATNLGERVPSAAIADAVEISGGQEPTEGEHNALVGTVNAILAAMRVQKSIAIS